MIWLALMITLIVLFYNPNPLYLEWAHRFTCVPPIGEAEGKARCPKPSDEVSHFKVFSCHLESFYSDLASMTINYKTITILYLPSLRPQWRFYLSLIHIFDTGSAVSAD